MRTPAKNSDRCGQMRTNADQMQTHADRRGQKNPTYLGTLYVLIVRKTYYYSIDCKKIQPRAIPYLRTYASVLLPALRDSYLLNVV